MANNMLKFRRGTYAQINAAPLDNGTIYIATNEKAMYVDTATERIRIGDFIRVDTVDKITPPYSTSSLYYVEKDNALLKYDGANWKQVNGTDDLADRLEAVEGDVATNKSDIGTLKTDVGTLKTDVSGLKTTVGTHGTDIEALKAAVGMDDEGNVEGLAGSVAQLRTDLTELETEVHGTNGNGGMVATLADHTSRIATLEGKDVALKSDVSAAKSAVLGQTDGVDFNGTVKGAYEAAATAQTQANKGVADAAAAKAIADTNKDDLSALTGRVTALDQAGTGRVAVLEGKVDTLEKAGYATVGQVNTAKGEVLGTEADAAGTATVHGALKSAAAAKSAADAAADAAAAAQGDIDAWETAHANDYTNTKIDELVANAKKAGTDAQADFDAYETAHAGDYTNTQIDNKVTTASNAAAAAKSAADDAQEDATQALSDAAAAQKTADDYIAAHKNDYTNTQIDTAVADAKKAGTDAAAIANANSGLISGHENRIAAIEADYLVQKDLDDAKAELSAEIDADINAANAMTYKGTIGSESEFNTIKASGKVSIGDTYVISSKFGAYQAGDFLIAKSKTDKETGGFISTDDLDWNHVKSGYDASLDQKLTGADNKIKLSTGTGLAGTEVSFKATGSASVSVADNTVTIGMVWEDF